MKRGLGVTIAIFICLVVQFVGLGVYMFMKLPDPPMLPLYWCGVAISGFAAIVKWAIAEQESLLNYTLPAFCGVGILLAGLVGLLPIS